MLSEMRRASVPERRTTPMPDRPGGVEIATMVCKTLARAFGSRRHVAEVRLACRDRANRRHRRAGADQAGADEWAPAAACPVEGPPLGGTVRFPCFRCEFRFRSSG